MPDLESLSIQISANAQSATSGLTSLITTLGKLKEATGDPARGLNKVGKALSGLGDVLNNLNASTLANLESLVTGLGSLKELSGLKMSSTLSKHLNGIIESLDKMSDEQIARVEKLGNALQAVAQTSSAGLSEVSNSLQQINANNNALMHFGSSNTPSTFSRVYAGFKNVANGLRVFKQFFNFGLEALKVSNQYIEDLNLYSVSMGEYAAEGKKFADTVGELMGIDPGQFMRFQGTFMTIARGLGVASDRAAIMSQNITQLGYDLSSLYNVGFEEAMQRLQSGLTGQIKGMRQFGYDLSDVALNEAALALGINKTTDAMNQAEKAELRYYVMMTNVTWAQNDMARTLNAPSNQLRLFKAQITQVVRAIGNLFIPILNAVLPILTAIASVLKTIINTIGSLFGFQLPDVDYSTVNYYDDVADSTGDMADNLGGAAANAKKMKDYLLSIDELNVLNPDTGVAGGGSGGSGKAGAGVGGSGLDFDLPTYDFFNGLVSSKASKITEKLKEWLGLSEGIASWSELWSSNLGGVLEILEGIAGGFIGSKIGKIFGNPMIGLTLGVGLTGIIDAFRHGPTMTNQLMAMIGSTLFGTSVGWKVAAASGSAIGAFVAPIAVIALLEMSYEMNNPESPEAQMRRAAGMADLDMFEKTYNIAGNTMQYINKETGEIKLFANADEAVGNINAGFEILRTSIKNAKGDVRDFLAEYRGSGRSIDDTKNMFIEGNQAWIDHMNSGFDSIRGGLLTLWGSFKDNVQSNGIVTWWKTNIIDKLSGVFGRLSSTVSSTFSGVTQNIVNSMTDGWNAFITGLGRVVNAIISGLSTVMSATWNSWKSLYRGLGFSDEQIAQMGNGTLTAWDYSQYLINKWSAPSSAIVKPGAPVRDPIYQTRASGGFVGSGQMFLARENGIPEMVGRIGNQTAVANNDQIVDAISAGVYAAMTSAMGEGTGNGGDIVITLDGEVLYKSNQRVARNKGYNLGMGVFA